MANNPPCVTRCVGCGLPLTEVSGMTDEKHRPWHLQCHARFLVELNNRHDSMSIFELATPQIEEHIQAERARKRLYREN